MLLAAHHISTARCPLLHEKSKRSGPCFMSPTSRQRPTQVPRKGALPREKRAVYHRKKYSRLLRGERIERQLEEIRQTFPTTSLCVSDRVRSGRLPGAHARRVGGHGFHAARRLGAVCSVLCALCTVHCEQRYMMDKYYTFHRRSACTAVHGG